MTAKYILAALASVFLIAGALGLARGERRSQSRTWLLIGGIFGAVSFWLFASG
jgi:hypothetical protein